MKANIKQTFEFDPEDYSNNIACEYDYGNHPQLPVFQHCARCYFSKVDQFGKPLKIDLCTMCGYHKNGLKLCNDCFEEVSEAKKAMEHIEETLNG